jgi:dolichol-phosphate mannosyltransferase
MPGPAWVILPTYEEAATLPTVVAALRAAVPEAHVLVVDDASPDGTGALADALAARDPHVEVLHHPRKDGLGRAYARGFAHALAAGAGHVVQMDADLSHDPADVPRLLERARGGADLVLGSRYVPGAVVAGWGAPRRALSRAGCTYARRVLGVPVRDLTGGLKCFTAETLAAVDAVGARAHGYAFQVELTWRALRLGRRVEEIPITFRARRVGASKMSAAIAFEASWRIPALRLGLAAPERLWSAVADADLRGHES